MSVFGLWRYTVLCRLLPMCENGDFFVLSLRAVCGPISIFLKSENQSLQSEVCLINDFKKWSEAQKDQLSLYLSPPLRSQDEHSASCPFPQHPMLHGQGPLRLTQGGDGLLLLPRVVTIQHWELQVKGLTGHCWGSQSRELVGGKLGNWGVRINFWGCSVNTDTTQYPSHIRQ